MLQQRELPNVWAHNTSTALVNGEIPDKLYWIRPVKHLHQAQKWGWWYLWSHQSFSLFIKEQFNKAVACWNPPALWFTASRPALSASSAHRRTNRRHPRALAQPLTTMLPVLRSTREQEVISWSSGCLTEREFFFLSFFFPTEQICVYLCPSLSSSFPLPLLYLR